MKANTCISSVVIVTPLLVLLMSNTTGGGNTDPHTQNATGTSSSTGAPGEAHTCSQGGCHGAGNGNGSSGGLADNAGPGSISITSSPAMTGNHYVPGATYHMSVTVSETGKSIFGFDAEILDNSGNTDLHVNNTAGTLTITDPAHTRIAQAYGTGRATVTHSLNAGLSANAHTFVFDWTAPSTGTVNIYSSGVAGNNDNMASAADNVYLQYVLQVTPAATTGLDELSDASEVSLYPNPCKGQLTIHFGNLMNKPVEINLYSTDGRLVKTVDPRETPTGAINHTYDVSQLPPGIYMVSIRSGAKHMVKRCVVQ